MLRPLPRHARHFIPSFEADFHAARLFTNAFRHATLFRRRFSIYFIEDYKRVFIISSLLLTPP